MHGSLDVASRSHLELPGRSLSQDRRHEIGVDLFRRAEGDGAHVAALALHDATRIGQQCPLWITSLTAFLVGESAQIQWCQSPSRAKVSWPHFDSCRASGSTSKTRSIRHSMAERDR